MNPRVVIVDDEQHARQKIRQFLESEGDAEIVGEFSDADRAAEGIRQLAPDIVFLDVRLRAKSGFDVVEAIGPEAMPATVFVTAYDGYAVSAFDVHAVDYLLKPFDRTRFRTAMERAMARLTSRQRTPEGLVSLMQEVKAAMPKVTRPRRWIMVKRMDHASVLINTSEIQWIEAAGNYVSIHTGEARHLHRQPLGALADELDPTEFARVHRSVIVNLNYVHHISPWSGGDYHIVLKSGTELRLSRHYRDAFERALYGG